MPRGPSPAVFIADAVGLDFLNTIAVPSGAPVESLGSGEALLDWLEQTNLVPAEAVAEFRRLAMPGELDSVAAQARALREWFRGFVREHMGKPLTSRALQELAALNRILERDEEFGQIAKRDRRDEAAAGGLVWRAGRRWRSPDTLLLPIARALADLVCHEDFTHVKACQGETCTLLFIDRTHGRARRWCSMEICGNRAKQAAHRRRASTKQARVRK